MAKVNCAIYVRKSTEYGLEQEFNSLDNQEESCKAYIASQSFNGWAHFRTYSDGGISGGTMERPGLRAMMDDMARGLIQLVVVYKVDRLSRSIIDFHKMMQEFDKYKCDFVSITQSFDTSNSMGKLTLNMLLSFAQFEREVSSERVRDKIRASRAKGIWTGGIPWIGYDTINKKLAVNPAEAATVKMIFEKYLVLGSVTELSRHLRHAGIFNKKWTTTKGKIRGGNPFQTNVLHRLLREKIYTGVIEHKRTKTVAPGEHDAIISQELFDTVQEKLRHNTSGKSTTGAASPNLLSGKLYGANGKRFTNSVTKKSNGKPAIYYYATPKNYIRSSDIDTVVVDTVREFLNADLSTLPTNVAHNLKQIDHDKMIYMTRRDFIRTIIDRAVLTDSKITFFIKPDLAILPQFITDEFINQNSAPIKFIISNDAIIIERDIMIAKGTQLTKHNISRQGLMTVTDNNHMIVRAFALAWKYKEIYERTGDLKSLIKSEKTSWRTIYKYLGLAYLSPKVINALMSGRTNISLRNIFVIASKYTAFNEQEEIFQRIL